MLDRDKVLECYRANYQVAVDDGHTDDAARITLGRFRGQRVGVCLLMSPPADAPVDEVLDTLTNEVRPKDG